MSELNEVEKEPYVFGKDFLKDVETHLPALLETHDPAAMAQSYNVMLQVRLNRNVEVLINVLRGISNKLS